MSRRSALVSQHRLPEYDRERGSKRVLEIIRYLQMGGWEVSYLAIDGEPASRYVRQLNQMGVATYVGLTAEAEEAIRRSRPEVAVVAFWHAAAVILPLIRRLAPETKVVVDSVDLHFLREARRRFNASPRDHAAPLDADFASSLVHELNTYSNADAVLTVSEKEASLVNDVLGRQGFAHAVPLGEDASRSLLGFSSRQGILYVGNFRHLPNGEAVEYLCRAVLPRLDPELLAEHPVWVVGNAVTDEIRDSAAGLPGVHMVGWVPSVQPYLERARLSVVPLLHGAGVKGKLIHSLMVGTPVVTTSVGAEGLEVTDGDHVLVADGATAFAEAMSRVLEDPDLWQHLSTLGSERMLGLHRTKVVARRLVEVIEHVCRGGPRRPLVVQPDEDSIAPWWAQEYAHVHRHLRRVLTSTTPAGSTVLVVSGGDDDLLQVEGSAGWHFPRSDDGNHSGFHPADGDAAVAHLEALRARGAQFLAFPVTARWWLHHYKSLNRHLGDEYRLVHDDDVCTVYDLRATGRAVPTADIPRVLVLGAYTSQETVGAAAVMSALAASQAYDVSQCWAAIGAPPLTPTSKGVEIQSFGGATTLEAALGVLLETRQDIGPAYLVLVAGSVGMTEGFLDDFLSCQEGLGLAVAQPACDVGSEPPIPSLGRQFGVVARQTLDVGWYPLVGIHRSVYGSVELDPARPGRLGVPAGVAVGVIDACPVRLTSPEGAGSCAGLTRNESGEPIARRSTVVAVATSRDGFRAVSGGPSGAGPRVSVVIATHNRSALLAGCLRSLVDQTLATEHWEVVVVDDGSEDSTPEVCARYAGLLPLRHIRIGHGGRSSAKNLGALVARGDVVLFFDDDDVADTDLLEEHLRSHEAHPDLGTAVLGYTTWSPALEVTPVMHYATEVGHFLFAYHNIEDGQRLDFRYFWEGRVSCKRRLLLAHGLHDPRLAYTVDIELGYRLAKAGMSVLFNRKAVSYVARQIDFDDFCRRCEAKGAALRQIAGLHADPAIQAYAGVEGAAATWDAARGRLDARIGRTRQLETLFRQGGDERSAWLSELHDLYREVFTAFNAKGLVETEVAPGEANGPQLSVVIPVWDTTAQLAEMTARNVGRLWDVAELDVEVIVVDNGSSFRPKCLATASRRFDENRGVAAAWNAGSRLARSEVLAFVNNDVWVEPGWDVALRQAAMDGRRIAFPFTDHGDGVGARRPDQAGTAGWCFALKADLLQELGPFDELFSPAFFEDTDYWHRAWEAGVDLSPVPDAVVRHARRTTARHQPNLDWLFQSHRMKYGWKHGVDPSSAPPFYHRTVEDYRPAGEG